MARGSLQPRHKKGCGAKGKDNRVCRCSPTVYAVFEGRWENMGYLPQGWRKSDLQGFEEKLAEMRRALEAGEALAPRKAIRLDDYADRWFDDLHAAAEANRISKLTYNTYESNWHNHLRPAFGGLLIAAIDQASLRRYAAAKQAEGLATDTIKHSLTPLSAMLTDAVEEGLILANPLRQPKRARHRGSRRQALLPEGKRKQPKFLEPEEARALLAATPAEYRTMVLAALTTGFRRGELLGLRWEDIRWADRLIDLQRQLQDREVEGCKCQSEREVVLYSGLAHELGRRRQAEGYVFTQPNGEPWSNDGPARVFLRDAYEAAGLRQPGRAWHHLRHTYASVLADGGIRREVVEQLMGHRRKGTTSIYTHLFRNAFDGVEAALARAFGDTTPDESVPSTFTTHDV